MTLQLLKFILAFLFSLLCAKCVCACTKLVINNTTLILKCCANFYECPFFSVVSKE